MARDILIVDDESDIRLLMAGILEDEGYETREAANSTAGLEALRARRPSLVILDIWMQDSDLDGMEMLQVIRREHPSVPVVMISGHGNIETAVTAIKLGAYDFVEKPFKSDRLLQIVDRAIEAARLRRENEELRLRAGGDMDLIGGSAAASQLRNAVERVAPTGSRVLISGPAGVGKEVVARLIHRQSRRAQGPFIAINCATMRPDRLEIELFGIEAGADAADSPAKIGTFEQAHGGTLLLDEVADMPLETQGKIVRALQEQTFERVGGNTHVEVDVRVIASTNRDLAAEIAAGRFREDLFYRLSVVPVRVPPLRERRDDIPLMVERFLAHAADVSGLPRRRVTEEAMVALQAYDWPGNVRQLRNIIDWLLIMAPGGVEQAIGVDDLPGEIADAGAAPLRGAEDGEIMALPLREARELFERRYLDAQVARFGGNISRTATFVGMERSALHRKLRSLGLVGQERVGKTEA